MELRCVHYHTFDEHPNCFYEGKVRTDKLWFIEMGMKIGYLDIEASDLHADTGFMLSWAIKERGGKTYYDLIKRDEIYSLEFDKRILQNLLTELEKYDIIVTYYGTNFDIPLINSRAIFWGFEPVSNYKTQVQYVIGKNGEIKEKEKIVPKFYHWDLYYTVKSKLALSRNSLDVATSYFGIDGKTKLDRNIWLKGKYGDPQSLKYILEHNFYDVIILERLHNKLLQLQKWTKKGA